MQVLRSLSLSLLDNLILRHRPGQSHTDYVHFMRQTFDTTTKRNGSAAIHPHNIGLFMLRGISSNTGSFGKTKQCVINAFDTDYLLSANEVMDEEVSAPGTPAPDTSPPPVSAFLAASRGSHNGRGHNPCGPRGGRGLPNKCSAYGSLDHIMSSCTSLDDAHLKWTLAKRNMLVQKYGTRGGSASAYDALLSDVPANYADSLPTLEDCTYEYDDEVSVPFSSVALSASLTPSRDLSQFSVVNSACSINLTAYRSDFATFAPSSAPSRVGGVGVDMKGSCSVRISLRLAFGQTIHRTSHALYTPDLSSRSALRIGRLLSVSWMHSHSGCESIFPIDFDNGLLVVPT
jgi:hypothetical protein